jgi:hypothetical protein
MCPALSADELAKMAYENAGREISQSFDIQNSNMALAAGALAAILTVIGTGNLFLKHDVGGVPKLTTASHDRSTSLVSLLHEIADCLSAASSIQRCAAQCMEFSRW